MPDASANSEKTPSVASTARKPRMYGSALLRPSTTMPVAAPTRMPATSSTKITLPPRCVLAVRSTAGRTVAALTVTSVAPGVLIRVPSYRESRRFHRPHGAGRLKCGAPGDRLTQGASFGDVCHSDHMAVPTATALSLRVRPVAGFGNGLHRVLEHPPKFGAAAYGGLGGARVLFAHSLQSGTGLRRGGGRGRRSSDLCMVVAHCRVGQWRGSADAAMQRSGRRLRGAA